MKRIGILTSGGDAPGMNAAIRALVLTASQHQLEVVGFSHGFNGIFNREYRVLSNMDVLHIIQLGGTILKSARCAQLQQADGPQIAADVLHELEIDALVVIGGDGSFRGCMALSQFYRGQLVGLPGTIDNDVDGTDYTIGFATALDTALDAIDKIRDTADAFERTFLVEVMGRHTGYLALAAGIASAAEQIICPEYGAIDIQDLANDIRRFQQNYGKGSYIIVMAETMYKDGATALAQALSEQSGTECRAVVLGHLQRGGSPVGADRILATKLSAYAIEQLLAGRAHLMMAGEQAGHLGLYPLATTGEKHKKADTYLLAWQQNTLQQ
ncbi:MAG: ATP-dependent 6-phosphofructokinase [Gammaproteobacteria bacterium]|jgi:6-phosphofructokinase 1|nr:ATP-dependent 6-phosphofructokinase [Gammaproteobacteria bacterium]